MNIYQNIDDSVHIISKLLHIMLHLFYIMFDLSLYDIFKNEIRFSIVKIGNKNRILF